MPRPNARPRCYRCKKIQEVLSLCTMPSEELPNGCGSKYCADCILRHAPCCSPNSYGISEYVAPDTSEQGSAVPRNHDNTCCGCGSYWISINCSCGHRQCRNCAALFPYCTHCLPRSRRSLTYVSALTNELAPKRPRPREAYQCQYWACTDAADVYCNRCDSYWCREHICWCSYSEDSDTEERSLVTAETQRDLCLIGM